jgi:hypothetical protein
MAKKRKTKKRGRRRGMGAMPSGKMKKALGVLAEIVTANLAHEGISLLNKQGFMAADATSMGINMKQALVGGGVTIGATIGAALVSNDLAEGALRGVAVASSIQLKDSVVKPALGLNGLGAVSDYLNLYRKKGVNGTPAKAAPSIAGPVRL